MEILFGRRYILTKSPLENLSVHDGARLPVDHSVRDGLMPLPELLLTLSRFYRGRSPNWIQRRRGGLF